MKSLARAALAFSAVVFFAKPSFAEIVAAAAAKWHVGQTVTVEGVVSEVHTSRSSRTTFICMGDAYSSDAFTAVIFAHRMSAVGDLSGTRRQNRRHHRHHPELRRRAGNRHQRAGSNPREAKSTQRQIDRKAKFDKRDGLFRPRFSSGVARNEPQNDDDRDRNADKPEQCGTHDVLEIVSSHNAQRAALFRPANFGFSEERLQFAR